MEIYALESALLRARKRAAARGEDGTRLQEAAVRCYAQDAMDTIEASGRKLLAAVEEGDSLRMLLAALKRFTKREVCQQLESADCRPAALRSTCRWVMGRVYW